MKLHIIIIVLLLFSGICPATVSGLQAQRHRMTDRDVDKLRQDKISSSNGIASPLYFRADTVAKVPISSFHDSRELVKRGGLPDFFHKLDAGKPVTVAYVGGSVTQMNYKYRNQSATYIEQIFPAGHFFFINAGVSGTGTDLGACRIDEQVIREKADLVFLEFAVNGAYAPGMEGIIRQILKKSPETDICLLYAIYDGQSAFYNQGEIPETVRRLEKVADYYQLPSIHMGIEPSFLEAQGKLLFKGNPRDTGDILVFSDGIHPTEAGGYIYAAAIARSLEKMSGNAHKVRHKIPEPLFKDNWEDAKMISPQDVRFSNGWERIYPADNARLRPFAPWFPFLMEAKKPGASFSFSFEGREVGIFDIGGPEAGQLDLYVDGKKIKTLNRFNHWCNNRYRGQYDMIKLKPGKHDVVWMISEDMPDKKNILGKGNTDIILHPKKYNQTVIYLGKVLICGKLLSEPVK